MRTATRCLKRLLSLVCAALICGCFQTKDELTLNADGSGKVRLETRTRIPGEPLAGMGAHLGGDAVSVYPPLSESEARKFFPGNEFTVTVQEEKAGESERVLLIEAGFKDLRVLLASPYARAHALTLKIEGGQLILRALSGFEAAARLAEQKDEGGMFGAWMGKSGSGSLLAFQKHKDEFESEFRVTLPNAITTANGNRVGPTVTWAEHRTNSPTAADFAQKLGTVLEATCPAEGLKMAPATPLRLALLPFNQVQPGPIGEKVIGPDQKRVQAAVKFVPYAVKTTRTLDLSGEVGSLDNIAQLIGAMVMPSQLVPQKWGEGKLDEAVDARGNDLKLAGGRAVTVDQEQRHQGEENEEEGHAIQSHPPEIAEVRKTVTLRFQSPDWQIQEIARVKASISLHYLGGSQHLVKLTNAVPAAWIAQVANPMQMDVESSSRSLRDPVLAELGLGLKLVMGLAQSAFTTLMLQVSGPNASMSEVQVYDAAGRPWPTFLQQHAFGDTETCSITVAGRPKPPLSLAILTSGAGAIVNVPIVVEKIPLRQQSTTEPTSGQTGSSNP